MNKAKVKQLKERLQKLEDSLPSTDFIGKIINEKYNEITSKVREDSSIAALDEINSKLEKFKQDFRLEPIIKAIEDIQDGMAQMHDSVVSEFEQSTKAADLTRTELENLIKNTKDDLEGMTASEIKSLMDKISYLENELSFQDNTSKTQGQTLKQVISDFQSRITELDSLLKASQSENLTRSEDFTNKLTDSKTSSETIALELKKLREETLSRFANLGGGQANRNIAIGGNTSVLSRYTDINIKPGNNVTLTYSNNDTTKYLDLTITGSGGGTGITRTIETTTVSSVIGEVPATDYVVLANGGIQLILPTAVGNTNLYTVKNVGNSSVLVATTGGETIDGDTTIIMPVQYTSVDLISNNANWQIT